MSILPPSPEHRGPMSPVTSLAIKAIVLALLVSLPELLLINLELWATVAGAVWAFGGLLHYGQAGYIAAAIVLGLPALWASAQTVRLALQAEEVPNT